MLSRQFHLAFENSIAEDYVSEKFFQALVAGTVPIVYGAPNIREYAPANNSILVVADYPSAAQLARRMKELASDPDAYQSMMAWREHGPSKDFIATIDFSTVHSECRLCIKAADDYVRAYGHRDESIDPRLPSHLRSPPPSLVPHTLSGPLLRLLVRERNRFYFRPVFLRVVSLAALQHSILASFQATNHVPAFARRRHFNGTLELFSIYHAYVTAREARGPARILHDDQIRALRNNSRLEVVFV
jgi:glycoprotein 3-alpha-L-fucosyltransferase